MKSLSKNIFTHILLLLILTLSLNGASTSCPGETISNLDGTSVNATDSDSGTIYGDTTYYYKFTPAEDGTLQVNSDVSSCYSNSLFIRSSCSGGILWQDTSNGDEKSSPEIDVSAGQQIIVALQRRYNSSKNFNIEFNFTSSVITYTETADDICYDEVQQTGLCTSFMSWNCTTTYPVRNISNENLTDVQVIHNEDGMTGSFSSDCSISPSGTCQEENNLDMGPFGMFGKATSFNFDSAITPTQTDATIATKSMMSMDFFTTTSLYAIYEKDGVYYRGVMSPCPEVTDGGRNFEIRNPEETRNIKGNIKVIGNSVLCYKNAQGVCQDTDLANNRVSLSFIDVDSDDYTFNNSSKAQISDVPNTAEIVWAGFYTQGYLKTTETATLSALRATPNYLTTPTGQVISLNTDVIDIYPYQSNEYTYSTFKEVKELIGMSGNDINGWFTGANIKALTGDDTGALGYFGAWSLVIIYEEQSETLKNISVFDGYKQIGGSNDSIDVSGFLTPTSGDVTSTLSVFVGEGDKNIDGDDIELNDISLTPGSNKNAFNSTINGFSTSPNPINYQGIDIHNYDVGVDGDSSHLQIIGNGESSAKIDLITTGDYYYPSVVAFTTELYEPRVCYYIDSIKDSQGNAIFEDTGDGSGPKFTSEIQNGEEYTYDIWISNMAQDPTDINLEIAQLVQIYMHMDNFEYSNGTTLMNNMAGSYIAMSDTASDDLAEYDSSEKISTFRVGEGADSTQGGTLVPTVFSNNSKKSYIRFTGALDIQGDAEEIDLLDYLDFKASFKTDIVTISPENAQTISQCKDINSSATVGIAPAGLFNVIMSDQVSNMVVYGSDPMPDEESPLNAIPTQVSNKPFEIAVVALERDGDGNPTVLSPFKGVVALELIDQPQYAEGADNDLACAIAPTISTAPTYFYFPVNGGGAVFSEGNYLYEKASKDAAFRVKYLTNGINTEAIDWNCATNTYNCLWGMLVSTFGNNDSTPCKAVCEPGGGTGNNQASAACIECVFGGANAGSVCSRDNFAIRPDKFAITLPALLRSAQDYNASLSALQYDSAQPTLEYNVANAQADFFELDGNKTIYFPDNSVATNVALSLSDLNGTLEFGSDPIVISDGASSSVGLSFDDVGLVNIKMIDRTWAAVDISKGDSPADCSETGGYICGDVNATFIPDHFTLDTPTLHNAQNQTFTYFSNDLNHSAALNLTLVAKNADDDKTDNFTQNAWENPVNVTFVAPQVHGMDANKTEIDGGINLGFTSGQKVLAWSETNTSLQLNFNYQRATNTPLNPVEVNGTSITIDALSTYTSGGLTETVIGTAAADQNATFVYGRTNAPNQTFAASVGTALIYYEAYCSGTDTGGTVCNKALLPNGLSSKPINDPRWFANTLHTSVSGTAGSINKKGSAVGAGEVTATAATGNHQDSTILTYDGTKDLPYKTTMENNASNWLIFNQYNPSAVKNQFKIEFTGNTTDWSGLHESNTTSTGTSSPWTNRRVDW